MWTDSSGRVGIEWRRIDWAGQINHEHLCLPITTRGGPRGVGQYPHISTTRYTGPLCVSIIASLYHRPVKRLPQKSSKSIYVVFILFSGRPFTRHYTIIIKRDNKRNNSINSRYGLSSRYWANNWGIFISPTNSIPTQGETVGRIRKGWRGKRPSPNKHFYVVVHFIQCTLFLWGNCGRNRVPNFGFNQSNIISHGQATSTISGKIAVTNTIIGTNKIIIFQFPGLQLSPWRVQFKTLHKLWTKL